MELTQKQKEVIQSNNRVKILNWGRRSGKTTVIAYEIFIALWNKEGLVSYYAPTHSDARDIAWNIFKEVLEPITIKTNESLLEITTKNEKGTTSMLRLTGWEAVKNRDKGRGVENNLLVLDEVAFYPNFVEKFETVLEPTLLTTKGNIVMASTPNGFNHFYEIVNKATELDHYYSHATSYDNPNNDPDELERFKREKTDDVFSQEYLADFRKKQGLVYKEFNRNHHIYDSIEIREKEKIAGLDFGFNHPTALIEITVDTENRFWVTKEWYHSGKTHEEIADYVASRQIPKVYPDPEDASAIETLKRKGVNIREVIKGKGSVNAGIQKIKELFKQNRLFIHKDCKNLIIELETYSYKDNSEEPIKEGDDAVDALRYPIMMYDNRESDIDRILAMKNKSAFKRGLLNYK